jgi:hypothetical protein
VFTFPTSPCIRLSMLITPRFSRQQYVLVGLKASQCGRVLLRLHLPMFRYFSTAEAAYPAYRDQAIFSLELVPAPLQASTPGELRHPIVPCQSIWLLLALSHYRTQSVTYELCVALPILCLDVEGPSRWRWSLRLGAQSPQPLCFALVSKIDVLSSSFLPVG